MAFSIEMFSDKNELTGKFIIDGKNLIITFGRKRTIATQVENNLGDKRREVSRKILEKALDAMPDWLHLYNKIDTEDDALHLHRDHISEYDKQTKHQHLVFHVVINFDFINRLFNEFKKYPSDLDPIMSKNNRREILSALEGYFKELATCQTAQALDREYTLERERKLNKYLTQAKNQQVILPTGIGLTQVNPIQPENNVIAKPKAAVNQSGFFDSFKKTTNSKADQIKPAPKTNNDLTGGFYAGFARAMRKN